MEQDRKIQRVWRLCAKPLSRHQVQRSNSSHCEYALLLPNLVGAACPHCKAVCLTMIYFYKETFLVLFNNIVWYCGFYIVLVFVVVVVFCLFWGYFLISLQNCRMLRKEILNEILVSLKSLGKFLLTSPGSASLFSTVPCIFLLGDTQIKCALLTNQNIFL